MRAYPKDKLFDTSIDLKDRYVLGIRDRVLSTQLKASDNYNDWTYTETLTKAQRIHGSAILVHQAYTGKAGVSSDSVNSIEVGTLDNLQQEPMVAAIHTTASSTKKSMKCFNCSKEGHFARDCTSPVRNRGFGNRPSTFRPRPTFTQRTLNRGRTQRNSTWKPRPSPFSHKGTSRTPWSAKRGVHAIIEEEAEDHSLMDFGLEELPEHSPSSNMGSGNDHRRAG